MAENLVAGHKTLGADKGYDTHDFVMEVREFGITPHVAQNAYETATAQRRSAAAPLAIPATRSARKSASASRRSSAG